MFLIVDLLTASVPYVAIVPDFWVKEGRCSYPKKRGDVAAIRREKPKENWLVYDCIVRKQFDSFQAAKDKENRACEQNELTTASEAENAGGIIGGKGCRKKTPTRRYSPTTDLDDSGESSDGMYGPTQDILPSIPIPSGLQQRNTNLECSVNGKELVSVHLYKIWSSATKLIDPYFTVTQMDGGISINLHPDEIQGTLGSPCELFPTAKRFSSPDVLEISRMSL
ncbi:hypothetical protein OUZ56_018666 [Daphnia magna]|uniref:Uncharacterized protein n=1 Tax=Daphnia magna TaxID=35525 RepID=A0ABQ9Z9F4_9CRUS|nr:hypothetical protein OUZ56_018666 [Daphnia magna]